MKNLSGLLYASLALGLMIFLFSCQHQPTFVQPIARGGYPKEVAAILIDRCATSGCHNQASYMNAGGLLLDTWEHLMDGSNSGAVVVPFNARNSSLLYFINRNGDSGIVATPNMPLNGNPLSVSEYNVIKEWIAKGAPGAGGSIPFASIPETRQKVYLTQQGCDLLAVIDADKHLVMRYIPVGTQGGIEAPHCVRVDAQGRYAYVSFIAGQWLQKIDTRTDSIAGAVNIGFGSWNVFMLSPDGKKAIVSNWQSNGGVVFINTTDMSVTQTVSGVFNYPHGIASNVSFDTFFITSQYGNTVYKLAPSGYFREISIDGDPPVQLPRKRDPHEIVMDTSYSRYFLTCEASNEVRVMDAHTDTLIKAIPVGILPQEIVLSRTQPYIFVTCTEDNSSFPGYKGSVYVINYNTLEIVKRIDGRFYQPHAISVDDSRGLLYIASRNSNPNGPAPHHSSNCAGRNGYYNIYDLTTLEPAAANKRYEVSVEPYSSDVRFRHQ